MLRDPFVEKPRKKHPGFNVSVVLGNQKLVKGKLGLEIEVEGNKFPKVLGYEGTHKPMAMPGWKYWSYVHDGSLRGKDNAEYVLTNPIEFNETKDALDELWGQLKTYGSKLDDSNRTSVHVHLNCQEFHLNRLTALMALYFTFEKPLTQWCGEHRVGNLFCQRASDATGIISAIRKFIKSDGKYEFNEGMHYAGLNASALKQHGSLEVRTLRGVNDPAVILDWVQILQRLYDLSSTYEDPRDVCGLFSGYGPIGFFNTVLGEKATTVRSGINFTEEELRDSLYEGIRFAQDLCYCRDWDLYKPSILKEDPFKRDLKKVAKKVLAADWNYSDPVPVGMEQVVLGSDSQTIVNNWNSSYWGFQN